MRESVFMSEILRPFVAPPATEAERPFLPFSAAIQERIVDLNVLVMRQLTEPLGVILGNLRMPQHNDAGVVSLDPNADDFIAVDHTRLIDIKQRQITLGPSSKDAVDKQSGRFQDEGLLTIATPTGGLRVVGAVIDRIKNPWLAEEYEVLRTAGRLAVVRFGLEALDYEVTDIDTKTGSISAKPRTNVL